MNSTVATEIWCVWAPISLSAWSSVGSEAVVEVVLVDPVVVVEEGRVVVVVGTVIAVVVVGGKVVVVVVVGGMREAVDGVAPAGSAAKDVVGVAAVVVEVGEMTAPASPSRSSGGVD